jgi:phospholipase D-like protein/VCBS repeat protein
MLEIRFSNMASEPPGARGRANGILPTLLAVGIVLSSSTAAVGQERMMLPAVDNALAVLVGKINAERVRVDVATWYLNDGDLVTAILNKHRSGVPVRLIGDRGSIFEADPQTRANFEFLAQNGVPIRLRYHPTWFPEIMHWKCGIFVGQQTVEFGSANWTTIELAPWSPTIFKDETAFFSDDPPLFNAFLTQFDRMWADTEKFLDWPAAYLAETGRAWPTAMSIPQGRQAPDFPTDIPGMIWSQGTDLTNAMLAEINAETQAIDLVIYRLTVPSITDALIQKHRSGVAVRVIVEPTQYRNQLYPEYELTGANIDRLWAAGVPIKQRQHEGLTHMKTLVTSRTALNGSSNFTKNWERDHNYFIPAATKPGPYSAIKNRFNAMWTDAANYVPFQPQIPSPAELSSPASANVPINTRLEWKRAFWAVAYDVYLGPSPSNMSLVGRVNADLTETPPETYSFVLPQPLQPGTTFYWRIVSRTFATDVSPGFMASSELRAFTTAGNSGGVTGPGPFGTAPVLWQNADGRIAVWYMSQTSLVDGRPLGPGTLPDPAWRIAATGDFDRDGYSDVIFQHQGDGRLAIWKMSGSFLVSGYALTPGQVQDTNWKIRAAADMDGDGWLDLIWQHETNGSVAVWLMTGTQLRDGRLTTPGVVSDTNWRIVGAGDVNGDGHADLVWQHQTNGLISAWLMNGTVCLDGVLLSPGQVTDTNWKIRSVMDVNNDGRLDLVWHNQATGFLSVWLMNGIVRIGDGLRLNPTSVSDTNWQIVGPR